MPRYASILRPAAVAAVCATLMAATIVPADAAVVVTSRSDGLGRVVTIKGDGADDRIVVACSAGTFTVDGAAYGSCGDLDGITVDGGGGTNSADLSGLVLGAGFLGRVEVQGVASAVGSPGEETIRLDRPTGTASGGGGADAIYGGGTVTGGPGSDILWGGRVLDGGPGFDQLMPDPTTGVSARDGQIQIAESVRREARVWQDGTVPAYVRNRVLTRITLRPSRAVLVGPGGFRHAIRLAAVRGWVAGFQTGRVVRARRVDARGMRGPGIGFGGAGRDTILGGRGADVLAGFAAYDVEDRGLHRRSGRDVLRGGRGNDVLRGGRGDDLLVGGRGVDMLDCGAGHDVAVADRRDDVRGCEVVRYR